MKKQIKDLNYSEEMLESLGVIPFTLRKDTLKDEEIISWTTSPRFFSEEMKDSKKRVDYVFGNAKKVGLDEMAMPDQPKDGEVCHELTFEEVVSQYKEKRAHDEGTIWNIDKKYDAVFMTRETHYRIMEYLGRSISLVYPAADCAVIRLYDKKNDVIGITHSDIKHTTGNIIGEMVKYMQEHFGSNKEDIVVFVGAFAQTGMIWDKYPPFAEENKEEWENYIEKVDDTHYNILYCDKIYDQLVGSGLKEENIYFDPDNTVENKNYFSNNRSKTQNEREGRNLVGISFDSLPIFESNEQEGNNIRFK